MCKSLLSTLSIKTPSLLALHNSFKVEIYSLFKVIPIIIRLMSDYSSYSVNLSIEILLALSSPSVKATIHLLWSDLG